MTQRDTSSPALSSADTPKDATAPTASGNYRLHNSLGYHLSLASRLQERRLDESLRTLGLTRTTWCILLGVGNEGLQQPSDIAKFVGIDRTATSRALRHMENDGLVARSSGEGDKRTRHVELTAKGCNVIATATPFAEHNAEVLAQRLSHGEQDELIRLLSKLTRGENMDLSRL